jgi:hypothetical protein
MVVEYLDVGGHVPHVRGAFVADKEIDELLRQSEPKAHDAWQTAIGEEGIDPLAPKAAGSVIHKVKTSVREFKRRLRPPARPEEDIHLPILQGLMHRLLAGASSDETLPVIHNVVTANVQQELFAAEAPGRVSLRATVDIALVPHHFRPSDLMAVDLVYRFIEDGRSGSECASTVQPPDGFVRDGTSGNVFVGVLSKEPARFVLTTESYSSEWTGRLAVGAQALPEKERRP